MRHAGSAGGHQGTREAKGFVHIRQLGQFGRDLKIADDIGGIDHDHSLRQDMWILEVEPVRFSEVRSPIIRQEGDIGDLGFLGKPFLRKRSIDADCDQSR